MSLASQRRMKMGAVHRRMDGGGGDLGREAVARRSQRRAGAWLRLERLIADAGKPAARCREALNSETMVIYSI